ncbi:AI-2E family transporter [Roseimaritima ulvae]|uniref:AI-2 transport protein TqsA n=1 Tax=Roseimaritima ulvae TaxID=980254 RepID=A0A5B9QUB9_9BACT|nr:AI-2E family transporter [Roseimaritima ulvae]QEG41005.1 AI-2 transport protein TqsA [Roseimaritima ulvae]
MGNEKQTIDGKQTIDARDNSPPSRIDSRIETEPTSPAEQRMDLGQRSVAAPLSKIASPAVASAESASTHRPPDGWLRWMVTLIAALLLIGTLYVASELWVPLVIAALAYLSLRPIQAKLCRTGMPQALASGLLIAALFSTLALIVSLLYSPAQRWIDMAPESLATIQDKFRTIAEPLTTIDRADETLDEATMPLDTDSPRLTVEYEKPSLIDETTLINHTGKWLAFVAAVAVLTFFMLSTGDDLLNRLLGILPRQSARAEVLEKISDIQLSVGRYLAQITCINIALGIAVTVVMWFAGMPTPLLWGVLATLCNFVPYVGPLAATAVVFLAAAGTFETIGQAALTALLFWLTTAIEGQFVTPAILGKTLRVGPVVVLTAVAFWGFLWGLPGVFLAVPLLIVQRKVFASFDATYPFAVVLGETPRDCHSETDCAPVQEDKTIAEVA